MSTTSREHARGQALQPNGHPHQKFVREVIDKSLTTEEVKEGFPALWAHLQECEECAAAFTELMRLTYQRGRWDGHAEGSKTRHVIILTFLAGILTVAVLVGGFLLWRPMTEDAAVNRIYESMSPAVANIRVKSSGTISGSGVVFDRNGYVLTNYHVIREAQDDQDIVVTLPGLGEVPSKLVGHDIPTDLAVLKVDVSPGRLTAVEFGDSDAVEVGDLAIAIGNPFGLSNSTTVGHISAIDRRLMSNDPYAPDVRGVLQTDAAINPGNSGGPLFNADGKVIGINTRIESPSKGSVGLGFAIPSEITLQVARAIIQRGYVRRPFLGIAGRPLDAKLAQELDLPVDRGLLVQRIRLDSPAAKIGLNAGDETVETSYGEVKRGADVILSVDGQTVQDQEDLNQRVAQYEIGDKIQLQVLRNGQRIALDVTLTERPWHLWAEKPEAGRGQVSGNLVG